MKECQTPPRQPPALQSPAIASQGQAQPEASDKGLQVVQPRRRSSLWKANTQTDSRGFWPRNPGKQAIDSESPRCKVAEFI